MVGKSGRAKGRHKSPRNVAAINVIVILLCVISLVPMLVIGVYDRPSADDFAYSMLTHEAFLQTGGNPIAVLSAAVQTSADYYNTWQGLYTSAFLLALQPGIAGSSYYALGAYLIIAFIVATCLYLSYCVEHHALKLRTGLWPAAGMLAATLFMQCMPYANEGIYWYNGAANYTPIFFATFISVGLCITALSVGKRWQHVLAVVLASAVSFVISGGNYMPAFFNIMVMVAFAGIGFMKRRPALVVPLLVAIAGFAISAMAPGTAIRQSVLSSMFEHPSIAGTLVHSAYRMLMDLRLYVDLPVIVFLAAVTPLIVFWATRTEARFSGKVFWISFAAALVFMTGSLCVPFYAMGSFGEGRVHDVAFFIDITLVIGLYGYGICWLVTHVDELGRLSERMVGHMKLPAMTALVLVAVLTVSFYGSSVAHGGNSALALRSLASGEAARYAQEYDAREAVLLGADGGNATITTLTERPVLLFFSDVLRNDEDWSDELARYYGLKSVTIVPAEGFERNVTFDE